MQQFAQKAMDALARGHRVVTHDVWGVGRPGEEPPRGFIIKQIRVAILLVKGMIDDALPVRAAALTFVTVLSTVPMLILTLFIVKAMDIEKQVVDFLTVTLQGWLQQNLYQLPSARQETIDPVSWLIDRALVGSEPENLGWVGILFVVACVFGLMANIERSFNKIWGLRRSRPWYRILSDYVTISVVLPLLVAGALSATVAIRQELLSGPLAWTVSLGYAALIWLAFAAMYSFVPNTRVKFQYALLAGIVAGSLWIAFSWAFTWSWSGMVGRYSLIYSAMAAVPILLMWIYLSWIIVLFGAELTFAYQNEKTFGMERLAQGASYAYREALGIWTMTALAQRFDDGEPGLTVQESAEAWNVPTRLLNDTLDTLENAGLVRSCAGEPPSYVPARSIERIAVEDVLTTMRESGSNPSGLREEELFNALSDESGMARNELMHASLATLVSKIHLPARPALPQHVESDDEQQAEDPGT